MNKIELSTDDRSIDSNSYRIAEPRLGDVVERLAVMCCYQKAVFMELFDSGNVDDFCKRGGALAGNTILYTVWVQIWQLDRIVYTSRFEVIFANSRRYRQETATPRRSILHAAKSLQMPYTAKLRKDVFYS